MKTQNTGSAAAIEKLRGLIESLGVLELAKIGDAEAPAGGGAASARMDSYELYVHDVIDADAEKKRLTKSLEEAEKSVKALTGRLNNKGYTDKAPAHLVQQTRDQLVKAEEDVTALREQIAGL